MDVSWSKAAAFDAAESVTWKVAESEAKTMFSEDSVPGEAVTFSVLLQMVELPCGLEVYFEVVDGDRIHIQWVKGFGS